MKAYKMEVLVIDLDALGMDEIKSVIEGTRLTAAEVKSVVSVDVGQWSDEHPLNQRVTSEKEYERLFSPFTRNIESIELANAVARFLDLKPQDEIPFSVLTQKLQDLTRKNNADID